MMKYSCSSEIKKLLESINFNSSIHFVEINDERMLFSEHYSCPYCDFTVPKLEPAMFSFNSPLGACPECKGLGVISSVDVDLLVPEPSLSIADGAIRYLKNIVFSDNIEWQQYKKLCDYYEIDVFKPYNELTDLQKEVLFTILKPYGFSRALINELLKIINSDKNKVVSKLLDNFSFVLG